MRQRTVVTLSGQLLFLVASGAQAGGLWLNEYGDFSGGRASAGAAAGVDDASTMLHNPASLARLKGSQLLIGAAALQPSLKFSADDPNAGPGGGNGGDGGVFSPSAGIFYAADLESDRWDVGIYFSGLAGTSLDYDDDWIGRYQSIENGLVVAALAPTLSYRINDQLAIGASLQLVSASVELSAKVPALGPSGREGQVSLDGSDFTEGFTLGVLYQLSPSTRLGVGYQSEVEPDFAGDLSFRRVDRSVETNTRLTLAQKVRVGLRHQLSDQWALDMSLGWDDWSALDEVFVAVGDTGAGIRKDARDTTHVALGVEYRLSNPWLLTAGVSYDTNPMDADQRTADLPLDRVWRVAGGAEYQPHDDWKLAFYANYADLGSATIKTANWQGDYGTAAIYQLGFSYSWLF